MPRKVFFSFHYDDVTRVNVVRNSDQITRRYTKAARFHDKSLWEEVKKQGPLAIKRMINGGLDGRSVTCVLIGSQTWQRRWVRYEIIKSLARGNGILGVRIHDVGFKPGQPTNALAGLFGTSPPSIALAGYGSRQEPTLGGLLGMATERPAPPENSLLGALLAGDQSVAPTPQPGPNPLRFLGYTVDRRYGMVRFLPGQIAHWPLARLRPYARNARTHDVDQVTRIAASMAEFGWTVPCLVDADGELIAGHGRVLAAAQLGLTEAPVIVLDHLTEAQRRAYRIADNKLTELGGWDEALLLEELRGLMAEEFDLGLIGIPEEELDALLHDAGEDRAPIDDDTADTIPEAPAEPITRPGDIWALGDHRLICGDATDPKVVARLMQDEAATLMFTSPPYAQQRDYGAAKEQVGDWDRLMRGVFALAPVTDAAQLLVNLGLVHRDGEWIPYYALRRLFEGAQRR